jgi:hypothetical protein
LIGLGAAAEAALDIFWRATMVLDSKYGFLECADLIAEQRYVAALKVFQQAIGNLLESKSAPKRSEIARQLLQIGMTLEDSLKKAYGEKWESHIPTSSEKDKEAGCSFCGKGQNEVRKLIAGPSVHICDQCVSLCHEIVSEELDPDTQATKAKSKEDRLCGICMEPRETDELIFLPHAAYMCAGCLEQLQLVRDKQQGS